jgi:hypothetical protein
MNLDTSFILPLLLLITIVLISIYGFENGQPTCNNFIFNTYLYLSFSILLLGIFSRYISKIMKLTSQTHIFGFVFSFLLVLYMATRQTYQSSIEDVVFSHLAWIAFIFCISMSFSLYFDVPFFRKQMFDVSMIVSYVFLVMSSIVFLFPDFFASTYNIATSTLLVSLIVIILSELTMLLSSSSNKNALLKYYKYTTYLSIVIFSLYVSYDTSKMFALSEKCTKMPNYPKTSVNFFLDIINLFSRFMALKSRR